MRRAAVPPILRTLSGGTVAQILAAISEAAGTPFPAPSRIGIIAQDLRNDDVLFYYMCIGAPTGFFLGLRKFWSVMPAQQTLLSFFESAAVRPILGNISGYKTPIRSGCLVL